MPILGVVAANGEKYNYVNAFLCSGTARFTSIKSKVFPTRSSLPVQNFDGLGLESSGDAPSIRLSLSLNSLVQLIKLEVLLLDTLKHIDLAGVVVVHEAPAAGVNELARVRLGDLALAGSQASQLDLAWRQQVNSRDRLVADGNLTLGSAHVNSAESREILEEGAIGRSHGQLHLGQLGQDAKVPDVVLGKHAISRCYTS